MIDNQLPLYIKVFNDRVRAMNSANARILTLTNQEAQGLYAEIYDLMATISYLNRTQISAGETVTSLKVDGGSFK
jgi:hypothetical protein